MNADAFRHFYAYHFAENRKIWEYATQLTDEQFTQAVAYSHGSVRDQIVHLISCDEIWFRVFNDLGVKTTSQDYIFYVYEHLV